MKCCFESENHKSSVEMEEGHTSFPVMHEALLAFQGSLDYLDLVYPAPQLSGHSQNAVMHMCSMQQVSWYTCKPVNTSYVALGHESMLSLRLHCALVTTSHMPSCNILLVLTSNQPVHQLLLVAVMYRYTMSCVHIVCVCILYIVFHNQEILVSLARRCMCLQSYWNRMSDTLR